LARDIGERLNSGAYLTALRRTRVGDTRVEDCLTIEQFLEQLNDYVQNE
jgi:tRNA pseudouridine55 synthase